MTKIGSATLSLSGANTYSGITTVSDGTFTVAGAGALGASTPNNYTAGITNNATFVYASSANQTLSGVITGTGALTKNNSNSSTLTLSAANDYTGATLISNGTVKISNSAALGNSSAGTTVDAGATLDVAGTGTLSSAEPITINGTTATNGAVYFSETATLTGTVALGSATKINVASGKTGEMSGVISGANALTKADSGTLKLSSANTYTGATTISAGTLNATNNKALGDNDTTRSDTTVANGATLLVSGGLSGLTDPIFLNGPGVGNNGSLLVQGTNTLSGLVTLSTSSEIGADSGATLTLAGGVSGTNVDVTFDGAGNILASGAISL
ncbi:MAG: autotransporter-associated beta strand repeat-containing protein, partial [Actinomycetota bacterium]